VCCVLCVVLLEVLDLKDTYISYKCNYNDYILLIKSGNFYVCLNDDAIVLKNIFNYKIIKQKNFIKAGFPINSINKIINRLDNLGVNYAVIDKYIILENSFFYNRYNLFAQADSFEGRMERINEIHRLLTINLHRNNFEEILNEIEHIVCKINS
jgi:hypothetical protein